MKKKRNRIILSVFLGSLLLTGIVFWAITRNSEAINASMQLENAIEQDDTEKAKEIIEQCPESVNTLPTFSPRLWRNLSEQPEVFYPLQRACSYKNYEIAKLLIESGADCNLTSEGLESSRPPLSLAVSNPENSRSSEGTTEKLVELLLENGADINGSASNGVTALMECVYNSISWSVTAEEFDPYAEKTAKFILEKGADVNAVSNYGDTALMKAVDFNGAGEGAVKVLLQYGADINLEDKNGDTAYDIALENGREELAALIKPDNRDL